LLLQLLLLLHALQLLHEPLRIERAILVNPAAIVECLLQLQELKQQLELALRWRSLPRTSTTATRSRCMCCPLHLLQQHGGRGGC
jgi:hypothetical protein